MNRGFSFGCKRAALCACVSAVTIWAAPVAMAADEPGSSSVAIVTPLSLVKRADLDMGSIIPSNSAGTVTLGLDNSRTATNGIVLVGGNHHVARFAGQGTILQRVQIRLPNNINLTGPGPNMRMDNFGFGPDADLPLTYLRLGNSPNVRLLGLNGIFGFVVAARLAVGANQPGGLYSATFDVTANYQ